MKDQELMTTSTILPLNIHCSNQIFICCSVFTWLVAAVVGCKAEAYLEI